MSADTDWLNHLTRSQVAIAADLRLTDATSLFIFRPQDERYIFLRHPLQSASFLRDGCVQRSIASSSPLSVYSSDVGRQVGWSTVIKAAGNTNNQLQGWDQTHAHCAQLPSLRAVVIGFRRSI